MKRMWVLSGLVLLAAVASPVGAIEVPQTRQEFVTAVTAGRGATVAETTVVDRDFAEVYADVEKRCTPCLDVEVRRSGFVGGQMEVSSSDYNPTLVRTGRESAEFTLQVVHRPRGVGHTPPPGGLYIMAADIRSAGKGRTEIVLYRSKIGFKQIYRSFARWASGEDGSCPKMK